ncbi:hypothetical protein TNCV_1088781 [Trichonephila clavipes]|uniref:Uncharacterized protein n=1 Tax=Trichonephila clavipes TaxID=2585209 RepID=A0A8X6SNM0_TRICX|nr:hypothetical protein TNCV_1088781 [Trichonephila clavipes]
METLISSPAASEVRSVIKFLNAESIAPIEIHRQLCQVYWVNIMRKQMVRRWCSSVPNLWRWIGGITIYCIEVQPVSGSGNFHSFPTRRTRQQLFSYSKAFGDEPSLFGPWSMAQQPVRLTVPISIFMTLDPEVHEQMFRSGDQSDAEPPVVSSLASFGTPPTEGIPSPGFELRTCGVEARKSF